MTTDCVGGVWTYTLDLARELTVTGHDVVLAVMGAELAPDQAEELQASGVAALAARPYRLEWMPDCEDDLTAAGEWLLDLAGEHQPDVLHCNQFNVASLPWPCPVLVVAHSDVVSWWRAVHGHDPGPEWDAYRRRVAQGLAAASLVVAPTAAMLRDLRAAYEFTTPTAVVHNGRVFATAAQPKEPRLAAVGRVWDEAKNLGAAARVAQQLAWPLTVAGEGAGAGDGAQWLGRVPPAQVADLLARAAVFVEPARYEPFGLAALEAGLAGCALVLGDIRSLREVWDDAATFVDPADEAALHDALRALVDDDRLLAQRQRAAAERAGTFTVSAAAAAYADHYADIAAARAPSDQVAS